MNFQLRLCPTKSVVCLAKDPKSVNFFGPHKYVLSISIDNIFPTVSRILHLLSYIIDVPSPPYLFIWDPHICSLYHVLNRANKGTYVSVHQAPFFPGPLFLVLSSLCSPFSSFPFLLVAYIYFLSRNLGNPFEHRKAYHAIEILNLFRVEAKFQRYAYCIITLGIFYSLSYVSVFPAEYYRASLGLFCDVHFKYSLQRISTC